MRQRSSVALACLLTGSALVAPAVSGAAGAEEPAYTVTTLHFAVTVGPDDSTACDVVGDLYLPTGADRGRPVPAILTSNGFGGSKDDQAGIGRAFAERGYAVLSYSGLGFGGSSCRITLDDPDWDGKAGSQLVSYLGGADGIAFHDAAHTDPAPVLDVVRRDRPGDPRVGMVGGSYGGGNQFATAGVDPRVDALVPIVTWNDLSYSLAPNGTDQLSGVSTRTPGATKVLWGAGFSGFGLTGDPQNGQVPGEPLPCPNFAAFVCPALVTAGTTGYFLPAHVDRLRHASVASYVERIKVPTLLVQGEDDTLFNLNEAVATYRALEAQGTETKMVWAQFGHSGPAAPGELDVSAPDPATQYVTARIAAWFERHLEGRPVDTGPEFAYFRPWVAYDGIATPAYGTASAYPVGTERTYRLSGSGALTTGLAAPGLQLFTTPGAGLPTAVDEADVVGAFLGDPVEEVADLPGTFASWQTRVLTAPLDVAGAPTLRLRLQAPTAALTQGAGPAGQLVLFAKIADVAPDGTARLVHGLQVPVRVPDVTKAFAVELPAIVHRFEAGHRLRLIVAGGSPSFRGGLEPTPVVIASGSGQVLTVPVL